MPELDAVVIGAGPNGLTAAVVLARAGLRVRVFEAAATVGGGARTAAITEPGFRHDICSAVHPLGVGSPAWRDWPLDQFGLRWAHPDVALAHPMPDGRAAALVRSLGDTADGLGRDGGRYRAWLSPFTGRWFDLAADVLRPLLAAPPRHPLLTARFGVRAAAPAALVLRAFRDAATQAMVAGLAAHAISPLGAPMTGGIALVFALAAHEVGWPMPLGGSQSIADALTGYLRSLGGDVETDTPVQSIDELPSASAYICDVSPRSLVAITGSRLPSRYRSALARFVYGPAVFKLDYALDGPVPWRADVCRRAGTVHVGGPADAVGTALAAASRGHPPESPFLITAQPSLVDPCRAPPGKHVFWAYGHVPNGWRGDLTDGVERQLERFAPGFRDLVLARASAGPADLQRGNANYVGGDIACGRFGGVQAIFRPVLARFPHATPDAAVYLCSSATPPGPGVHGMCGYHAAHLALERVFGRREPTAGAG
jgi:phytoene dehydrogenase-like protein